MLEAVFWKPQFRWQVTEIWVLRPVRYQSLFRNEITQRQTLAGGYIDVAESRTQRHTLALRDARYRIHATVEVHPDCDDDPAKFRDQFRRRIERGACFHRPYLGCREFAADFGPASTSDAPLNLDQDLGIMLYDIDYIPDGDGRGTPMFFHAQLDRGVVRVPHIDDVREGHINA
jgi:CRISPR-associated protein Cas5d